MTTSLVHTIKASGLKVLSRALKRFFLSTLVLNSSFSLLSDTEIMEKVRRRGGFLICPSTK